MINSTQNDQARVFAALGDRTRLELIADLCRNEDKSISQLTVGLQLTRQAVTKHLRVLEDAKVVTSKRIGRESRFSIEKNTLVSAVKYLTRASAQWDAVIDRIATSVE